MPLPKRMLDAQNFKKSEKKMPSSPEKLYVAIRNVLESSDVFHRGLGDTLGKKPDGKEQLDLLHRRKMFVLRVWQEQLPLQGFEAFDQQILKLAEAYAKAVESGNVRGTYAAIRGLEISIIVLREKNKRLNEEDAVSYVGRWLTLVSCTSEQEIQETRLATCKQKYEQMESEYNRCLESFDEHCRQDPSIKKQLEEFGAGAPAAAPPVWLKQEMTQLNFLNVERKIARKMWEQQQNFTLNLQFKMHSFGVSTCMMPILHTQDERKLTEQFASQEQCALYQPATLDFRTLPERAAQEQLCMDVEWVSHAAPSIGKAVQALYAQYREVGRTESEPMVLCTVHTALTAIMAMTERCASQKEHVGLQDCLRYAAVWSSIMEQMKVIQQAAKNLDAMADYYRMQKQKLDSLTDKAESEMSLTTTWLEQIRAVKEGTVGEEGIHLPVQKILSEMRMHRSVMQYVGGELQQQQAALEPLLKRIQGVLQRMGCEVVWATENPLIAEAIAVKEAGKAVPETLTFTMADLREEVELLLERIQKKQERAIQKLLNK